MRAGFRLTAFASVRVSLVDVVTVAEERAVGVRRAPAVIVTLLLALGAREAVVTLAVFGDDAVGGGVLVDERAVVAALVARRTEPALMTYTKDTYTV